jgi:endoglucanase
MSHCTIRFRKSVYLLLVLAMLAPAAGCKQGPWTLWNAYSARFIDPQGRVVDPQGAGRTTSEGQAYAMFFALADNDRPAFNRLLTWTRNNLAAGDMSAHLPGWLWGKSPTGEWKLLDSNPASDADVWMAYTLIEAGRLWKAPSYSALGRQMMAMIAKTEVSDLPGFGLMLLPGPAGYVHQTSPNLHSWTLNPSYVPLFLFERLAKEDPDGPWQHVALNIPRFLRLSAVHGYAMDWVSYIPGDGFYPASAPSSAHPDRETEEPRGSYDAIRVYLWAGMIDPGDRQKEEILSAIPAMSLYLVDHGAPPEKVSDQGIPLAQDGPAGFSAAMLPYLRSYAGQEKPRARQTIRLSMMKDRTSGLYGKDQAYYDQNLGLFATGFLEARFRFGAGGELRVEWESA